MKGERPTYRELPDGFARTYFGEGDTRGCLNLITAEVVLEACALVRDGRIFSVNGRVGEWPNPSPAGPTVRPPPTLTEFEIVEGKVLDDRLDGFYLQSGSQWDAFSHMIEAPAALDHGYSSALRTIGMSALAESGILSNFTLLDLARWFEETGRPIDWRSRTVIETPDLRQCAQWQGTTVKEGAVVLIRTGWESGYRQLSADERMEYSQSRSPVPGLSADLEMAELLWNWGVSAVAADNPSLEATPYDVPLEQSLHYKLLVELGMPIGELWLLDQVAKYCALAGRYDGLICSAPMNIEGAVGSPANALLAM